MWTAVMAKDQAGFENLIAPIYKFMNGTPNRVPMTDWSWTLEPNQRGFQARSVLGGFYINLLKDLYLQKILFQRFVPDGKSAIDTIKQFKENIKDISSNKLIKNIENVEQNRRQIAPYRCFFTWGMHYNCNYNCAYCYAPKPQDITFGNNPNNVAKYEKTENIIDSWKKIYDKYGSSRIRLDGGEPSIYPNFFEIIKELSKIHRLQMNTNLSFDVNKFCENTNPETIRVDASLHCEYTKLETFVEKLNVLKQKGYKLTVSYVGYPDFLENIPLAKKTIEAMHIPFFVHPYSGFYEDRQYPQSYTEQDKKVYHDRLFKEFFLVYYNEYLFYSAYFTAEEKEQAQRYIDEYVSKYYIPV